MKRILIILTTLFFFSCDNTAEDIKRIELEPYTGSGEIFVLNQNSSGSITSHIIDSNRTNQADFKYRNNSKELGSNPNQIYKTENLVIIPVASSGLIRILDHSMTERSLIPISVNGESWSPQYVTLVGEKLFVSAAAVYPASGKTDPD